MQLSRVYEISDSLNEEFYSRIKYNFKLHVLVCMARINLNREYILQEICKLEGYQQHKCVKFDGKWIHIIIKFMEEQQAENAVIYYLNSRFSVACVDDLLRGWFDFEMKTGYLPTRTLTVVDILGTPPKSLNFLTENLLNCVLKDFGQPFVTPYTAAIKKAHVQVMFYSMTEAFAACMALGFWYRSNKRTDNFAYRVRINPSEKEASLIIGSGGIPDVAFRYDWFINSKSDTSAEKRKEDSKIQTPQTKRDAFLKRKMQGRKQNSTVNRLQSPQIEIPRVFSTPVMCVPVIAPIDETGAPTFVIASQQVEDMANTFMLHPAFIEAGEHGTLPIISDPGMRVYASSSLYENPERSQSCSYQEESIYKGEQLRAPIRTLISPGQVSMQRIPHQSVEY